MALSPQKVKNIVTCIPIEAAPVAIINAAITRSMSPLRTTASLAWASCFPIPPEPHGGQAPRSSPCSSKPPKIIGEAGVTRNLPDSPLASHHYFNAYLYCCQVFLNAI